MIEVDGRIAGGGLILSVQADERAASIDIVPATSDFAADERADRFHHRGSVVRFTGLPGSGKSTLALEQRLFAMAARRPCSTETPCAPA